MATIVNSHGAWLRRHLAWSIFRQSWGERLSEVGLLAGAGFLLGFARNWPMAHQAVLWGLLLAATASLLRFGRIKLFGPLLMYDLVRTARRRQFVAVRCGFALCLLMGLFCVWAGAILHSDPRLRALVSTSVLERTELADLNSYCFFTVMGLQLLAAFVLTPACTGGAIAREKERQTLEFLLATELSNREIVLSVLVSRLANLLLVFLTGLPILSAMQFLGGVDPDLLLAGYAALGLTVLSLASLGILCSVHARRLHAGVAGTYLAAFGYLASTTATKLLLPRLAKVFPSTSTWTWPQQLVDGLCAGNLVTAGIDLHNGVASGSALNQLLPGVLGSYAWFHVLAAAGCTGLAVLRLRSAALREPRRPAPKKAQRSPLRLRPWFGNWPMLGKEIFSGSRPGRDWLARLGIGLLVTASFLPAAYSFYHLGWRKIPLIDWGHLEGVINGWALRACPILACLMLLQVTIRAAGSISGERVRQTLDILRTTPLDSSGILFAKWLGSILSWRWAWWWLGSIWVTAYLLGGLDAAAIPRLVLAWLVFAGFQAGLGLCFSIDSRSTERAMLWTMLTTLIFWGGHWLFWLAFGPLFHWDRHERRMLRVVQEFGWTPPMALVQLTRKVGNSVEAAEKGIYVWAGVIVWGLGGVVLWCWASYRFRKAIGRFSVSRSPDCVGAKR